MSIKGNENNNRALLAIITEVATMQNPSEDKVLKVFRKHPKDSSGLFKKSDVLQAYHQLIDDGEFHLTAQERRQFEHLITLKKTRTMSGVTPVTVLTKPFPCPGKCIFCPNDVRMPKSYLSDEPGAQRALRNRFDPYQQTYNRLLAYNQIGHPTDKVELIILGGTWTSYPEAYQIWFVKRCFDAMNDFLPDQKPTISDTVHEMPFDEQKIEKVHGAHIEKTYNRIISQALIPKQESAKTEHASWEDLFSVQKKNQTALTRCIGLVIETRPDEISEQEVIRIRKLGATKVQIGFQSLNDTVLEKNHRGHSVKTTKNAVNLLRQAGFKIHAHWMPNLYGSNPEDDIKDFSKMFSDESLKPDELKIYPCSLIESAELMSYYKKGLWNPYTPQELLDVLVGCYTLTPEYCRITRMIRDFSSDDIVEGNKTTNFRQIVEKHLTEKQVEIKEIRYREIRDQAISLDSLRRSEIRYSTAVSEEYFLQYVTEDNHIAGFLRLSHPRDTKSKHFITELQNSAIIREVHVYGPSIEIGETRSGITQHLGLGKRLIQRAEELSREKGYDDISVISSIGTREYYHALGYRQHELYQHKSLEKTSS